MSDSIIVGEGVTKTYFRRGRERAREFNAVDGVTIEVRMGELTEIEGRSGSGKTTLVSMLSGLLAPTSGRVLVDGRDLYALGDAERSRLRAQRIAVVAQGQTALEDLTVRENVEMALSLAGVGGDRSARALEALDALGVSELFETRASLLSGGEMRRMALARALACEPRALFLDEPTADLDDENTEMVLGLLRRTADAGCAVVLVTHETSARAYADRLLRMGAGRLTEVGEDGAL